ncbi:SpoIIE family protein phosphatase [Deltaproteobacteria bacterium]|nr:SpoIIE family protein phosphatase [Deltaproteobacteria bacterium]
METSNNHEEKTDLSEIAKLEEEVSKQNKRIKNLEMQIKLGGNLAKELERQKSLAIEAQEEVKKSLQYSSRIQGAMLPSSLPDDLTLATIWKPLNVVGGDFYVIKDLGETILIAVIDCTGHGVPGALLSTLTGSIFDRLIHDPNVNMAGEYLMAAHNLISAMLGQHVDSKAKSNDGFDGSICLVDKQTKTLSFAGARSSVFLLQNNGDPLEFNGNRKSVGGSRTPLDYPFDTHEIDLGDQILVMFTDGILDVMSEEPNLFLFGKDRLLNILSLWNDQDPERIINNVGIALDNHRGTQPFRDDMTMVAFRLN